MLACYTPLACQRSTIGVNMVVIVMAWGVAWDEGMKHSVKTKIKRYEVEVYSELFKESSYDGANRSRKTRQIINNQIIIKKFFITLEKVPISIRIVINLQQRRRFGSLQ